MINAKNLLFFYLFTSCKAKQAKEKRIQVYILEEEEKSNSKL